MPLASGARGNEVSDSFRKEANLKKQKGAPQGTPFSERSEGNEVSDCQAQRARSIRRIRRIKKAKRPVKSLHPDRKDAPVMRDLSKKALQRNIINANTPFLRVNFE